LRCASSTAFAASIACAFAAFAISVARFNSASAALYLACAALAFAVNSRSESFAFDNVLACASAAAFFAASAFLAALISSTVGFLVAAIAGETTPVNKEIAAKTAIVFLRI